MSVFAFRIVCPIVIVACASVAQAASASPSDEAEGLIKRGIQLRRTGDDIAALPLFERAFKLSPSPRSAAQLGFAEEAIGRSADAERHITDALRGGSDPWVKQHHDVIQQALAGIKTRVGTVEIVGEPDGATVQINGRDYGRIPLAAPLRITAGTVHVELSAPGHAPMDSTFQLAGGGHESVVMRLHLQEAGAGAPGDSPAKEPSVSTVEVQPRASAQPAAVASVSPLKIARWGSLAAAGVALSVGTFAILQYRARVDEFNGKRDAANQKRCFDSGSAIQGPNMSVAESDCVTLASKYHSSRTLAIYAYGTGAALLVAVGVLTVIGWESPRSNVALGCGIGPRMLSCGGTF